MMELNFTCFSHFEVTPKNLYAFLISIFIMQKYYFQKEVKNEPSGY
jgi:hypothetical protein